MMREAKSRQMSRTARQVGLAAIALASAACASRAPTSTAVAGSGSSPSESGSSPSESGKVVGMAVTVTVSPASVSLPPNGSEAFTCTVSGSTNDACTWRVTEAGGGAINAQGMYTAPGTGGTYHVTA